VDLAAEVREYFSPDFSNWKNHDASKLSLILSFFSDPCPSVAKQLYPVNPVILSERSR